MWSTTDRLPRCGRRIARFRSVPMSFAALTPSTNPTRSFPLGADIGALDTVSPQRCGVTRSKGCRCPYHDDVAQVRQMGLS